MIRKHIRILYGLFGVLTVAFLILAVAVGAGLLRRC